MSLLLLGQAVVPALIRVRWTLEKLAHPELCLALKKQTRRISITLSTKHLVALQSELRDQHRYGSASAQSCEVLVEMFIDPGYNYYGMLFIPTTVRLFPSSYMSSDDHEAFCGPTRRCPLFDAQ